MVKRLIEHPSTHIQDQLQSLAFPRGSTILDIGAGPGTLAVPLTKEGHIVTVVEPSKAMKDVMEQYKQYCGVTTDIPIIERLWENVDPAEIGTYESVQSIRQSIGHSFFLIEITSPRNIMIQPFHY